MTTYYVSPDGNNANNGLGPDASHATNKPWATPAKAMNTGATPTSGDTVWFAPGEYFDCNLIPIAGVAGVTYRGDPYNAQGFKDGSAVRRAPGIVYFGQRAASERDALPVANVDLITLSTNDPVNITFRDLFLDGGHRRAILTGVDAPTGLQVYDCLLVGGGANGGAVIQYAIGAAQAGGLGHRYYRCTIIGGAQGIFLDHATAAAVADVDIDVEAYDSLYIGSGAASSCFIGSSSAQAGNKFGGMVLDHCTSISFNLMRASAGHSTVAKSTARGCLLIGGNALFVGATSADSVIVDGGYNRIVGGQNASTFVTELATTKRAVMPNIMLPHYHKWGWPNTRKVFGWLPTADAEQRFSGETNTRSDFFDGYARPWGGGPSIGAVQSVNVSQDTGSQITGGGANSLKIQGAGDAPEEGPIEIQVPSGSSVRTVKTKSTSYGGSSWPQAILRAEPDLGVDADIIATATSASEQTLTLNITTTKAGALQLVLRSRSSDENSLTYFDLIT